jgi:hypothetical protein
MENWRHTHILHIPKVDSISRPFCPDVAGQHQAAMIQLYFFGMINVYYKPNTGSTFWDDERVL